MSPEQLPESIVPSCAGCSRPDRRQFLASASVLSLGALATAACGDGVFSGPETIPAFPAATFSFDPRAVAALQQVGGRTVVQNGTTAPVLVERLGTSQYRALSLACPHRGTIVDVSGDGFLCPNHGARFAADGTWLSGQATVDLAPVAVRLNPDGTLTIGGTPPPPALGLSAASAVFTTTVTGSSPAAQSIQVTNSGGGSLGALQVGLAYATNQRSGWLSVELNTATAPAILTIAATKGTLPAGVYNATITVNALGATNGPQTVAVSFVVSDPATAPSMQLSASALVFSAPLGTTATAQLVQISNAGGGSVSGLSAQVAYGAGATGWLAATLLQTTAPATLTVRPTSTTLAPGTYTATISVSATGLPPRTITVTLTVTPGGLLVNIAAWPALANVGGVSGSVGNVNGGPVAVVRTSDTSFSAFSMVCPHAGTTINVINGTSFRCPNHGALFNANGTLQPNSPQRTESLTRLTVIYTPGASTLTVT
ncbi:Rieske 2Fe-2S domain-containing protein [Gemmatimonas sp.]|jgi:Rieske Fe-S protein|uniref:Rieske 2Fe-2S domain-containing protein n=1 Tax=Gemmatimonas sp. TaxID=1962908 RepID=UPI0037C15F9C